jgi:hypothetical protein
MLRTRTGAAARACFAAVIAVTISLVAAPNVLAHNAANCAGYLAEDGAIYAGSCTFPFQGYPIGMAAKYEPGETTRPSEIHAEVLLRPAFGTPQSLSMECYSPALNPDGSTPVVYGTTKCISQYDSPETASQFTLVQAIPTEIVSMSCQAHSHARYSRFYPPSGEFACWSTIEGRQDLENDGILGEIGY